ncbi:MAG TPA: methyltransferase [Sphingobacteriaceae bacterium]
MGNLFRFKQFAVDQSNCAMKVNTDGVLLGALAYASDPQSILDIGAGTGVIALMLAQRYVTARVDAVEIDPQAAQTASLNFQNSAFADRLDLYPGSFVQFFATIPERKYDLIVTNPPFFLNSLKSASKAKETARHTDTEFFEDLFVLSARHLSHGGTLAMILPIDTAGAVEHLAHQAGLYGRWKIDVRSYPSSVPHREILGFGLTQTEPTRDDFIIYAAEKVYSPQYRHLLKDFLTIF